MIEFLKEKHNQCYSKDKMVRDWKKKEVFLSFSKNIASRSGLAHWPTLKKCFKYDLRETSEQNQIRIFFKSNNIEDKKLQAYK